MKCTSNDIQITLIHHVIWACWGGGAKVVGHPVYLPYIMYCIYAYILALLTNFANYFLKYNIIGTAQWHCLEMSIYLYADNFFVKYYYIGSVS